MNWSPKAWRNALADRISTHFCRCVLCDAAGHDGIDLCQPCRQDLPENAPCCPRCALPMTVAAAAEPCGRCQRDPPAFDRVVAPFRYESPCDYMVTQLKFSEKFYLGRLMGRLLADHLRGANICAPDIILPVPLHATRRRERGFNQSEHLARGVASHLHQPLATQLVSRTRNTTPQMELAASTRRQNVRGAFAVRQPVANRRVALVDDVVTTNATVNELARVLRKAGATHIQVWAFARA